MECKMQQAMFLNTSNLCIKDGVFIYGGCNSDHHSKPPLDRLREHCALGALLDAKERFDPPQCAPETREAIIKDIIDWVQDDEQSASILWLHGPAGAGKSAIAQTVARNCKNRGLLVASHFFSRSSSERSDGDRFIPTLTLQLLQAFPITNRYVKDVIDKDPEIFRSLRSKQMEELVIKPLNTRRLALLHFMTKWLFPSQNISGPQAYTSRLIVIDGLDECSNPEVQCDLLRMIALACSRIHLPLRFLIASRPEIHIQQAFGGVKRINLEDDPDANMAIRRYLLQEFEKIRRHNRFGANFYPSEDVIRRIVEKSSAQFIYASTVINYIRHPRGSPERRLEAILNISSSPVNDQPFAQLDDLYKHIFSSANGIDRGTVKRIFGIIFLASQPQHYYLEPSVAFLKSALALGTREIILFSDDFVSLIALSQDSTQRIRLFHISLFDFLRDPERSGEFTLDLSDAHEVLVATFSRLLNECKPLNILTIYHRLLLHFRGARLSINLRNDLLSSGFLIGRFVRTIEELSPAMAIDMAFILESFFDALLTKGSENNEDLHSTHAMQISQRLEGIVRMWDPSFEYDPGENPFMSRGYAAEYRVYKIMERISKHRGYGPAEMLQGMIPFCSRGPNRGKRVYKYHVVILFPQLCARAIVHCTGYASLVGDLIVGNELDDLVRQRAQTYINRVEQQIDDTSLERFSAAWGTYLG